MPNNDYYKNLYKTEINLYTDEYVNNIQKQILPYIKEPIHRIRLNGCIHNCQHCSKKASYYKVDDESLLCWKHGNELMKSS